MARFNEILSGRYNRFVEKLFSMKGPPPMPQVAAELQMVLAFFNGPANRFLEGWQTYANEAFLAGVGGQFSGVRFRNPAGSGVAAEILKITMQANVASPFSYQLQMGLSNVDLATVIGGTFGLDPRAGITQLGPNQYVNQSVVIESVQNSAAALPGALSKIYTWEINNAANGYVWEVLQKDEDVLPLMPGMSIQVATPTANGAPVDFTMWWRERVLEDSEKF